MKTPVVRIGDSRGVRIPKPLLEQAGLDDAAELLPRVDGLHPRRHKGARAGCDDQFERMVTEGNERPPDARTLPVVSFGQDDRHW